MRTRRLIRDALVGTAGIVIGIGTAALAYAAGMSPWIALVIGFIGGGVGTAVVGVVAWLIWPFPVDGQAMLGGPDDVYYRSPRWRQYAHWAERRGARGSR